MSRFFNSSRLAALAVVATLGTLASSAGAATVAYTTTGGFSAAGGASAITSGNSTLTFTGVTRSTELTSTLLQPFLPALLGSFTLVTADAVADAFNGSFTLTITQSTPVAVPDNASSTATIIGSVSTAPGSGVIVFTFTPTIISIGSIDYNLPSFVSISVPNNYTPNTPIGPVELTGSMVVPGNTPNVVPLPGALAAGSVLLGTLSVSRRARQSRAIAC